MSNGPLRYLGRISYGAYVYHWPIFIWLDDNLLRFGATLLLAAVSYRYFEEPIRAGSRVIGWQRYVAAPGAIGVVAIAFILGAPEQLETASFATGAENVRATGNEPEARISLGERIPRILVLGGSIARDVGVGLTDWSKRTRRTEILSMARPGCGIARGAWVGKQERRWAICDGWPAQARKNVAEFQPDLVVIVTIGWDFLHRQTADWKAPKIIGDPVFDTWMLGQFEEAVDLFQELDVDVVWLTTPCYRSEHGFKRGTWDPARMRRLNDYILPTLARGREDHFSIVDLETKVCPNGKYTNELFGIEEFRPDGTHFSPAGQRWLGGWLGPELLREISDRS